MVAKVPSEVQAAKSSRNPHVDNAKFLGMVLVCWSHLGAWFLKGGRVDIASSDVMLGDFETLERCDIICLVGPQKNRTMLFFFFDLLDSIAFCCDLGDIRV